MTSPANCVAHSLILALLLFCSGGTVFAADPLEPVPAKKTVSRDALLGLARQFVSKVENAKAVTETSPDESRGSRQGNRLSEEEKIQRAFDSLEDGEVLLLSLTLAADRQRDRIYIRDPIIAFKEGQDVMISLSEFAAIASFAIRIDAQSGRAAGWFIRESQIFNLDLNTGQVQVLDQVMSIPEGAVRVENDDILVKGEVLSEWFGFEMKVNPQRQVAEVVSEQKWPVEERIDRMNRAKRLAGRTPPPSQPRLDDPIAMVRVPNIDIHTRERISKPGQGDRSITKSSTFNVQTAGDLLGHTAEGYFSGNDQDRITNGRLTMTQISEEPDLLGPMKARTYSFIDVPSTPVPYAGATEFETGFRVSNKDPYTTFDATTTIYGDALPGWDVELYRGEQLVDSLQAGPDGRFEFTDVVLFAETNEFRIVQYGEQGEIREEQRTISVRPRSFNNENGAYDVSLSLQNTQLYQKEDSTDTDRYQPHLAATYDYQLSQNLALRSGLQARQEEGKDRIYLQAGAVETFGRTVINQDVVANNEGAWTAALTGRHNIGKHNLFGSAQYESRDFAPGIDEPEPSELKMGATARGPLPDFIGTRNRYGLAARYTEEGDGSADRRFSASYGGKLKNIGFNNQISDRVVTNSDGSNREFIGDSFSLNGSAFGLSWRGTADYNIYPESRMESYLLNLRKRFSSTLNSELELEHLPPIDYTRAMLASSWRTKHALLTPILTYDSDNNISAILRTSMGISHNPYANEIHVVSENLSDRGGLSARVFLDKDGDGIYNNVDQLVEGAVIRALHARRQAETDENGEAYIYNMPIGKLTDVMVVEGSMFEPSWIPATPGVSVRPRAGHISRVEFPLVNSGEVDGTLYIASTQGNKPRLLRDAVIRLTDGSGRVVQETRTANDGFYLFTKIPPGRYYIIPDSDDLKAARASAIPPQPIDIGYDGTIIYGNDITYPAGAGVGFDMVSADTFGKIYPDLAVPAGSNVILNMGSYHSPLTMALMWYKFKMRYGRIAEGLSPLMRLGDHHADAGSGLYTLRLKMTSGNIDEAFQRCRALAARGIFCTIEYLPSQETNAAISASPAKS